MNVFHVLKSTFTSVNVFQESATYDTIIRLMEKAKSLTSTTQSTFGLIKPSWEILQTSIPVNSQTFPETVAINVQYSAEAQFH